MRTRLLTVLLGLMALPAIADDVYLTNGRSFEDVIAETTETQVRIQMPGGVLSLPRSQVLRVEKGESSLAEYLRRKEEIQRMPAGGKASDWLSLARWARSQKIEHGAREAALAAAQIDPRLEGLGTILRGFGYVYDEQVDRWTQYEDSMRRRGFVLSNGQWITREEHELAVRRMEEESARRHAARQEAVRAAREDRLAALTELALTREIRGSQPAPETAYPVLIIPGYYFPPAFVPPAQRGDPGPSQPPQHRPRHHQPDSGMSFNRVPGSLIPGDFSSSSSPGPRRH